MTDNAKPEPPTPVLFRTWPDGVVDAFFPTEPGTPDPSTCEVYSHIGQHSSGNLIACIARTRPATPDEYADLKRELEGIGYILDIRHRTSQKMHDARHAALRP